MPAPGQEWPAATAQGEEGKPNRCLRAFYFSAFSMSLSPFLTGSLTSLIYGEQSEKSSPSEISLEMERRDKVSAGATWPQGVLALGR